VSVAELCRRLGPVPATADSTETGATPLLVGELLRREGRAEVPVPEPVVAAPAAEIPESLGARPPGAARNDDLAIPVPRRRGEACKTALGAGGLVVAGSVLGAALLAAAGIGGALPVPQGDEGSGQFQGEGTLRSPGTAYGSVTGHSVMSGSRLVQAVGYYLPFARSSGTTAVPRVAGGTAGPPAGIVAAQAPARPGRPRR
jgi:hypothetical protein